MRKKLVPLSGISRSPGSRLHGKSFLFTLFVYMIKCAGSLTETSPLKGEISVSGMNRNPYKHFSPPAEVKFNRGAHSNSNNNGFRKTNNTPPLNNRIRTGSCCHS